MSDIKILLKIQDLLNEEENLKSQLKKLPHKSKLKSLKEEIESSQNRLMEQKNKYAELTHNLKNMEFDIESVKEKQKEISGKLYSGDSNNLKELESINFQLEQYNKEIYEMENVLLSYMEEKEGFLNDFKRQSADLNLIKDEFRKLYDEYNKQRVDLTKRLDVLPMEREQICAKVDKGLLKIYDDLRAKFKFQAVVEVEDNICGGCHMRISFDLQNKLKGKHELLYCDNCGRLLLTTDI